MLDINASIAKSLNIKVSQVAATVELIDQGNTIPFIARYRKEKTGSLNDEVLRSLSERLTYLRNLQERKETVLKSIEEQGKLDDALKNEIENCETMVALEDLYRPYKPKRKTRASIAIEKGLQPLADDIANGNIDKDLNQIAASYINEEKGVENSEQALQGASDILAESFSDDTKIHQYVRDYTFNKGKLVSVAKDEKADSVYQAYYSFNSNLNRVQGYQVLAIDRGEAQNFLTVKVEIDESDLLNKLNNLIIKEKNNYTYEFLVNAILDSYKRLLQPSIERDIRNELTEKAQDGAMLVFKSNLKQLLMAPPITNQIVLGWDPAFRTGCKLAVVDATGKVLDTKVVFVTAPATSAQVEQGKKDVIALINKYNVSLISCGNGTASRESEQIIVDIIKHCNHEVKYIITNEAGASVYSASKLASEEFPKFDVGQRSAVSIARRVQDPLAELVKIDPKSIGVGQYQHDMNQKKLGETLDGVVEDSVNTVGVDLNTASYSLLEHISGINHTIAKNIVSYREENGKFTNRNQLLKVAKLGPKAYQQAAGFMRIANGSEPLDNSSVHPESYEVAKSLIKQLDIEDIFTNGEGKPIALFKVKTVLKDNNKIKDLSKKLNIGEPTLIDILNEFIHPARDPREDAPAPILRSDVLSMEDLKVGMKLKGTVRNIVDFGVFVDIGVHQDGLIHKSKLSKKRVNNPLDVVKVNDVVEVTIIDINIDKKRIALSMID